VKVTTGTQPRPEGAEDAESSADEEKWVRCAACGARLAPERARIEVNGRHEHEFMNPGGMRFVVACFATAPGCMPDGEPSTVWTWFPGRAWQIALCKGCGAHVGWSFHAAGSPSFHGLVRDRIV
jgi:hypothetical protein